MSPPPQKGFANPSPLGLLAFGIACVLLNLQHSEVYPGKEASAIYGLGIAYAGLAQLLVGMLHFVKGNTFSHVVFTSFGSFWWTWVVMKIMPALQPTLFPAASPGFMGVYYFMWDLFAVTCWFCTFKMNRVLQFIFFTLWIFFSLSAAGQWSGDKLCQKVAAWFGFTCGAAAFYLALAELLNETVGSILLPIGDQKANESVAVMTANWVSLLTGKPVPTEAKDREMDLEAPIALSNAPPSAQTVFADDSGDRNKLNQSARLRPQNSSFREAAVG